jgi:ABC-type transport system involved in resistance to organic solvents, ATPase component
MSVNGSAMIEVRGLAKSIGPQEILRGVDLTVAKGETLVIIGRSGGGKSVLLKHLIGLMTPDAGEIWIDGENIIGLTERKLAPIRLKVGILFQNGALFDSMTVEENIAFPLEEAGERDPKKIAEKVREILEVIELEGEEKKMPVNLSGGMKKRVGLARSIIRRPSCVLYDEPTAGLDPVVSDSINRLIRRLQERFGVTSIVVTHDMKSAFHIADHIAYLHEGRIHFYGTPQELEVSQDPLIQDFMLGDPNARPRRIWLTHCPHVIESRLNPRPKMATRHSDKNVELKVGAFILVGLAVLAGLLVQFGRLGEGFQNYYQLLVKFPDASGLLKGSDVLLAGAKIGHVSGGPRLADSGQGVEVPLRIFGFVKIPAGSRFHRGFVGFARGSIRGGDRAARISQDFVRKTVSSKAPARRASTI